jgi:hypothetical protein
MSLNSAEAKLRTLASADPTMVADFGSGPFRWFQIQLPQGYISKGTCVRVRRVSAIYLYAQEGITQAEQVRLQFDVLDKSQDRARQVLNDLCSFVAGVDLMSDAQFTSPPSMPTQFANFLLSQRSGIEYQVEVEIFSWSADWRIWNDTTIT